MEDTWYKSLRTGLHIVIGFKSTSGDQKETTSSEHHVEHVNKVYTLSFQKVAKLTHYMMLVNSFDSCQLLLKSNPDKFLLATSNLGAFKSRPKTL